MKLSIVATMYRSAAYIAEFVRRASVTANVYAGNDYEIVLVNDGSPDNSLDLAIQLAENDTHIAIVDLSRNFGHHKAMMTGLTQSRGEHVFLLDSDLEESPEWLLEFAEHMSRESVDVVYGVQQTRRGGWFDRVSGEIYYSLFSFLCDIEHPRNVVTARLMTRRYVDALIQFQERELVISCLWVIVGFRQYGTYVNKLSGSATTYGPRKKLGHAVNAITSFSSVPLTMVFNLGVFVLTASLIFMALLVFRRVVYADHIDGWTSVIVSVWVIGGLVMLSLGVIGVYLSKIYIETKRRPNSIIRGVYGRFPEH